MLEPFVIQDIEPQIFADIAELPGNIEWFTEMGEGPVPAEDIPGCVYQGVIGNGTIGVCAALPINSVSMHVHIAFHPKHRRCVPLAARELLNNVRRTAHGQTLFSMIPDDNRPAIALARLLGMKERGRLTKAHRRHMERHDMVIFEVT